MATERIKLAVLNSWRLCYIEPTLFVVMVTIYILIGDTFEQALFV